MKHFKALVAGRVAVARRPPRLAGNINDRRNQAGAGAEKRAPLKQKIVAAEAEIARITEIIGKIDAALALPDLFTRDPKQAAQLSKARAAAATALEKAEEDWLEASSSYDQAAS